ncbi:hypothetical protein K6V33_10705, partial [Streptococcus suis]|nr:hypothetical protein [Streptococcus suis]
GKNEGREAFLFCPNSHYSGKKTDYQTNKQKKTNIKRDVCLHSGATAVAPYLQPQLERVSTKLLATYRFLTENNERGRHGIVSKVIKRSDSRRSSSPTSVGV